MRTKNDGKLRFLFGNPGLDFLVGIAVCLVISTILRNRFGDDRFFLLLIIFPVLFFARWKPKVRFQKIETHWEKKKRNREAEH